MLLDDELELEELLELDVLELEEALVLEELLLELELLEDDELLELELDDVLELELLEVDDELEELLVSAPQPISANRGMAMASVRAAKDAGVLVVMRLGVSCINFEIIV